MNWVKAHWMFIALAVAAWWLFARESAAPASANGTVAGGVSVTIGEPTFFRRT